MARTAAETASILSDLFDENFGRDSYAPFRITWPQLRTLAAVPRLDDIYLKEINTALSEDGKFLNFFDEFFLIAKEDDLAHFRMVPDRLLEQHLPDEKVAFDDSDESDDDEIE